MAGVGSRTGGRIAGEVTALMRSTRLSTRLSALPPVVALAVLALATPAAAIVLPVEARLTIEVGAVQPIVFDGAGVATVNGSGGGASIASLALGGGVVGGDPVLVPITDPGAMPISGLLGTVGNLPGTLATGGGALGGLVPLSGVLKVCLFGSGACSAPMANLSVPLSAVGGGGAGWVEGPVHLTVFGAPWTTGTAAIGSITRMGFAMGPASASGSTAQSGGRLQLVTPISVTTNIGASAIVPAFATLTLHFVPEPVTSVLLAGGVAALAAAGARRGRR